MNSEEDVKMETGVLAGGDRHGRVQVESLGKGIFRVRIVPRGPVKPGCDWGLERMERGPAEVVEEAGSTELRTSGGTCRMDGAGRVAFYRPNETEPVLEGLPSPPIYEHGPHGFKSLGSDLYRAVCRFRAREGERFYGLGQHHHGLWDQKGCVIQLEQRNSEVSIPFMVSSAGYGFIWNNPAKGRVELGRTETAWLAKATRQIDYIVILATCPAEILRNYSELTGRPSPMPDWALGFWQSTLRYETQAQAESVLAGYRERRLPLSVLVVDFFHWTKMGEWTFDPEKWPDVAAMVAKFRKEGVRLAVSVWPTVNPNARWFRKMRDAGWLVGTLRGNPGLFLFSDNDADRLYLPYYDATNPDARGFLWEQLKKNYFDEGVDVFWLDACEPDIKPADHDNLVFAAGAGEEICNAYPLLHTRGVYEGQRASGMEEPMNLVRSAWIGSQRYGAAVWSGDVPSTFEGLRQQVVAGLHMAMSGIAWWTTDIGGFFGGVTGDPAFHELLIRWFQFGTFCPLMRIHGIRRRAEGPGPGDNEVWSYGEPVEAILSGYIRIREELKPYLRTVMDDCHETGDPFLRPFFHAFPEDGRAWEVADAFLAGPDLLVAPVMEAGAREREVYLPGEDTIWLDDAGREYSGGTVVQCPAPLHRIPVFFRAGGLIEPGLLANLDSIGESRLE